MSFWRDLISENSPLSSKRFGGLISLGVVILMIILGFFIKISEVQANLTEKLLYGALGLLVGGALEKFKDMFKKS